MAFVLSGSHTGFNLFTLIAVDILSSSFMNPKSLCSTHDCVSIFIYTNCCLKETFFEISMEVISVSTFLKCFFIVHVIFRGTTKKLTKSSKQLYTKSSKDEKEKEEQKSKVSNLK